MQTFQQFTARYPVKTYDKGQVILLQGDAPKAVHLIEKGVTKTYTINANGEERLVLFTGEGEDFPIGYAFGLSEKARYFYEAFTKCTVRLIPRDDYIEYLHANPETMYKRHARLVTLLLTTLERIDALEQSRAGDKVARTLLYMAGQFGVNLKPHRARLKIAVTQQQIADSLGITRETTSIALKKLEVKKLITHSRKSYVLYMNRLRDYLGDDKTE
jgi:CRP/FNR family transcriptional regulator